MADTETLPADFVARPLSARQDDRPRWAEEDGMRWLCLALVLAVTEGAAAQDPAPTSNGTDPESYWPPEGRIGIAAAMGERGRGYCVLSMVLMNRTNQDFSSVITEMEVFLTEHMSVVVDALFRIVDSGKFRVADAYVDGACPARPRVVVRTMTCIAPAIGGDSCITITVPVSPPNRNRRPLPLTVYDPWADVVPAR